MDKKDALSRRNFIKASGMAALGAAALGLAGCGPKPAQNAANDAATSVADIAWDEEYDVIVVGAGAAGLATAVAMATEGGDLSTLLLEKGSTLIGSGNSPVCSGSFHITDEPDAFAVYMKAMLGGMTATPASVYETYAQGAAENWEWLSGLGMKEDDVKITPQGDGKAEWFELENSGSFSKCQFKKDNADEDRTHISKFLSAVLEQYPDQVTRKTSAPLTALVQDPETKAMIGAVYEDKNKSVYAKARKGVVMTCGGFENDPEMLQDYLSFERMHAAGASTNTGDGHRICAKLGAGMWHMVERHQPGRREDHAVPQPQEGARHRGGRQRAPLLPGMGRHHHVHEGRGRPAVAALRLPPRPPELRRRVEDAPPARQAVVRVRFRG